MTKLNDYTGTTARDRALSLLASAPAALANTEAARGLDPTTTPEADRIVTVRGAEPIETYREFEERTAILNRTDLQQRMDRLRNAVRSEPTRAERLAFAYGYLTNAVRRPYEGQLPLVVISAALEQGERSPY